MTHFSISESSPAQQRQLELLEKHPFLYRLRIVGLLLLGGLIFGGILLFGLLLVVLMLALLLTGKGAIIFLKLIKFFIILVIPLWGMLRLGWRMLSRRTPKPEGVKLKESDAPALFKALQKMQKKLKGPKVNAVFIDTQFNASAWTRPLGGFWFIPFRQRFIVLGVPLLQTLSADEAMAVLAHEYGHISGHPSRFDAFVYRLRYKLIALLEQAHQWTDWPSKMLCRALLWYIPLFDREVFALCRQAEYAADREAAELVSNVHLGESLMRFGVSHRYLSEYFWDKVYAGVGQSSTPNVRPWSQMADLLRTQADRDLTMRVLRDRLGERTDVNDTHPALADRLRALGMAPERLLKEGREIAPVAEKSAAEEWFGPCMAQILEPLDQAWLSEVGAQWQERHTLMAQKKVRYQTLLNQAALNAEETWELLMLRIDQEKLESEVADAEVDAFLQQYPAHSQAMLAYGRRWLNEDDERALPVLTRLLRIDPAKMGEVANLLENHALNNGDEHRATIYRLMRAQAPVSAQ